MRMDDNDNFDLNDDQLQESPYRKRHPALKILAAIVLLTFISLYIPQFSSLLNGSLDFLKNRVNPQDNSALNRGVAAVVSIESQNEDLFNYKSRQGTGFNISDTGIIVTNQHVVENARSIKIQFENGRVLYSNDIHIFDNADIAILNLDAQDLPYITLETDSVQESEDIVSVIGNPMGFKQVILQGPIMGYYTMQEIPVMLLDINCQPGNSGSPVINQQGQAIAIVYAVTTAQQDGKERNLTLAYPLYYFKDYFRELKYTED